MERMANYSKMRKNNLKALLIILVCVLVIYGIFKFLEPPRDNRMEFSFEEWESRPEQRYRMIDSMENKLRVIGLHREEILALLGTNQVTLDDNYLFYLIHNGKGLFNFPAYYWIYFDSDGNATMTQVLVD